MAFGTDEGRARLSAAGVDDVVLDALNHFGLSSICNVIAAIKVSRELDLGPDDALITLATDGSEMYGSERESMMAGRYATGFSDVDADAAVTTHLLGADAEHVEVLTELGRNRIFNLAYYTWVEQHGTEFADFEVRRSQDFWHHIQTFAPGWDVMIEEFNGRTGVLAS